MNKICESSNLFANALTDSSMPFAVMLLITSTSASAPARRIARAESISQFVPGKTGISTRGRAYLPFGFIIGAFLRKEPISTGVSSVVLCL